MALPPVVLLSFISTSAVEPPSQSATPLFNSLANPFDESIVTV